MTGSLGVVLPVFGLIAVGYGAAALRILTARVGDGLGQFVFTLAIPCLIFRTLVRADIPAVQPWGYWISYFLGVLVVWAVAMAAAKRLFALDETASVVMGFTAGQANTVFVGIPMILKAFGDEGAVPLFLLIAVHLPLMMMLATLLAEGRQASLAKVGRRLLANPIVLGILLGILARPVAPLVPEAVWRIPDLLGAAAVPCALVALGISLRRHGLEGGWPLPILICALKLVAHPLIVLILATRVFSMPPAWSGVAVLFAACPCGINAYLLAKHYRRGVAAASSAVALSTALAVPSTLIWLYVLGAA